MTGIKSFEQVGSRGPGKPIQIALWAFIPAYLLLHGIIATCLPEWLDPLSTIFIVLAEWIAIAACIHASRGADFETRIFWYLFSAAIAVHSVAMSLDAAVEITQAPVLNHVPGIQIFLSLLSGVPLLVAVSIQNDRRILRTARIVHASLSIAIGALIYFEIFSFLTVYGSRNPSDAVVVTHLFDAIDFFLAAAGTIRWLGASQQQERRFFRILAAFLWLDAILPAVHNRILMHHDYVWLDLLISAPYVVLVPLVQSAPSRPAKPPSPVFVRAIRSGSSIFLAVALIAVAFATARSHFYIGLVAALFAIAGYGTLNIFVQSRELETEDSLIASNAALGKLVELDGLTAIANRRAFDDRLNREFAISSRTQQPVSLLMIDVDMFKELNDTVGHVAGDEYLIQIAAALSRKLPRITDYVARYGGEEFAAILPATDQAGAMIVAETVRNGVAKLRLKHPTAATGVVTVSIGASTYDGSASCSPLDLTDSADRALYMAKRNGRNCSKFRQMDLPESADVISAVS
jgi:diguanylate cyclase (GGDEF)-like protein